MSLESMPEVTVGIICQTVCLWFVVRMRDGWWWGDWHTMEALEVNIND